MNKIDIHSPDKTIIDPKKDLEDVRFLHSKLIILRDKVCMLNQIVNSMKNQIKN